MDLNPVSTSFGELFVVSSNSKFKILVGGDSSKGLGARNRKLRNKFKTIQGIKN